MKPFELHLGDCLEVLKTLPDNSVDAVVTDPPYGIRFMGKAWDGADIEARAAERRGMNSHAPDAGPNGGHKSIAAEAGKYDLAPAAMKAFQEFSQAWAAEALRVLKPGGHLLSFASARTYHRMAAGIEDAGFEIRDQLLWVYGSGFPKSHNLDGEFEGWGTALKPSHEPVCMARKPFKATVLANMREWRTGAINIEASRVATDESTIRAESLMTSKGVPGGSYGQGIPRPQTGGVTGSEGGRWPANLLHDGSAEVVALFPSQAGAAAPVRGTEPSNSTKSVFGQIDRQASNAFHGDTGSAARFFYCAKASRADRNSGTMSGDVPAVSNQATMREREDADWSARNGNNHPTVKPTDLMAYLCRLITPPGGTVLDPFMGSGSTGKACMREGFHFIGIEREAEYHTIALARITHEHEEVTKAAEVANAPTPQLDLFADMGAA